MTRQSKTIELHIPNKLGFEKIATSAAATAAKMMEFSPDRIEDLKTAVGEACMNAIEHGIRQKRTARILVTMKVGRSKLEIDVQNKGGNFKKDVAKPDIKEKILGNSPSRGWGMFLIKNLVDKVEFQSTAKKGNITKMVIYIHGTQPKGSLKPRT